MQWGGITRRASAVGVDGGASSTMAPSIRRRHDGRLQLVRATPIGLRREAYLVAPAPGRCRRPSGSTFFMTKAQYLVNGSNGLPTY